MVVVAGLFDEQSQATQAMDTVLRLGIKDLDSRVVEHQGNMDQGTGPSVFPVIPNTSGGYSQSTPGAAAVPGFNSGMVGWLNDIDDEVERAFYMEGAREGATLAMVRVDDEHANHIRQIFQQNGARTYVED